MAMQRLDWEEVAAFPTEAAGDAMAGQPSPDLKLGRNGGSFFVAKRFYDPSEEKTGCPPASGLQPFPRPQATILVSFAIHAARQKVAQPGNNPFGSPTFQNRNKALYYLGWDIEHRYPPRGCIYSNLHVDGPVAQQGAGLSLFLILRGLRVCQTPTSRSTTG